ncbi:MFS transporter [Carnimonas nigrificans]|uniref:MFS transporter n=1 Tax=Carnimonas nigrificans TaxID=64323 RepID=UPI0004B6B15F|nr:MFS transporter [Carnimonas nigrificans]
MSTPRNGRRRFLVLAMIFGLTVINYADRSTMSIAGTSILKSLDINPVMLGVIFSAFAWAYAIGQIPGGWFVDRFGAKRVYGISIILWSTCTLLQGVTGWLGFSAMSAVVFLFIVRFLLGLVESPAFPANSRVVSCWFPTSERGTASALFNSAQYMAVVIFTPLMGIIVHELGWEYVFIIMGVLGFIAGAGWFMFYRDPKQDRHISPEELAFMEEGGALVNIEQNRREKKTRISLNEIMILFKQRNLWALYVGQYCITALTYFFITWFPIYLIQGRGMSIMQAGWIAALPAICGFLGGISGGALSDLMIRKGIHASAARKTPFIIGMLLSTTLVLANFTEQNTLVIALMSLAFLGKGFAAIGWAAVSDVAPPKMIGLCGGVFNGLGNIAGIITPIVIGYVVNVTGSFSLALWFVAAHGILGIFSYSIIATRFRRITDVE